jgi:hypothetical protein
LRDGIPKIAAVNTAGALISSNRAEFSAEDEEYLKEISDTITKMSKDRIAVEVCLAAVNCFWC